MALKSMVTPSMESDLLTARSPELHSDSTPTGRYFRWIGATWTWAPSLHHCFSLSTIFLFRDLRYARRRCGLLAAAFKWEVRDRKRQWELTRYRWLLKSKTFLYSLPSTVRRMYWRLILPRPPVTGAIRAYLNYRRVKNRINSMCPSYHKKTGHQKCGEYDGFA